MVAPVPCMLSAVGGSPWRARHRDRDPGDGITLSARGGYLVATPKAAITGPEQHRGPATSRWGPSRRSNIAREAAGLPRSPSRSALPSWSSTPSCPVPMPNSKPPGITATYARNRSYLWVALRPALADYPYPARPGSPTGPTRTEKKGGRGRLLLQTPRTNCGARLALILRVLGLECSWAFPPD